MLRFLVLAMCMLAVGAFTAPGVRCLVSSQQRCDSPAMQFFNPKKDGFESRNKPKGKRRGGSEFYDDERDTVSKPLWRFSDNDAGYDTKKYRSAAEASGFSESGNDLANAITCK